MVLQLQCTEAFKRQTDVGFELLLNDVVSCVVGFSGVRRNLSWGGVHSLAYGGHLYLVCAFCDVKI